jgi:hypothetical protein
MPISGMWTILSHFILSASIFLFSKLQLRPEELKILRTVTVQESVTQISYQNYHIYPMKRIRIIRKAIPLNRMLLVCAYGKACA